MAWDANRQDGSVMGEFIRMTTNCGLVNHSIRACMSKTIALQIYIFTLVIVIKLKKASFRELDSMKETCFVGQELIVKVDIKPNRLLFLSR